MPVDLTRSGASGLLVCTLFVLAACGEPEPAPVVGMGDNASTERLRIALFNIKELRSSKVESVDGDGRGNHPQLLAAAGIIRRVRPAILILNEVDHDDPANGRPLDYTARRFAELYLEVGEQPLGLSYSFAAPSNTGLLSGIDLNGDGYVATDEDRGERRHGNDSFGYGTYPGEYSMAVLSRLPIAAERARTFQRFRWRDLPGHHMPEDFLSPEAQGVFRLSSKSHWDLPIEVDGRHLHLLLSHPTPPVFDGDEDLNGRRNFDEIKFWVEYLYPGGGRPTIYDDRGNYGGYEASAPFLIAGDLNAPPGGSEAVYDGLSAIDQLLRHPSIRDAGEWLTSLGALKGREPGPPDHPERATAVFGDGVRIDYLLPSAEVEILAGGVFWPDRAGDPEGARWAEEASDHRLVWLDVALPVSRQPTPRS